jgi:hypothetical protein
MALSDVEYSRIAYFLGYSSTQHFVNIKTKIISSFALTPTLAADRENEIRDLLKQLKSYQEKIRKTEENAGVYQLPGQRLSSRDRTAELISGATNCVSDLEVQTDVARIGNVFSRDRGMGSVNVRRG